MDRYSGNNDSGTATASHPPDPQRRSMIGVSPTYVPNDYNDIHAGLYSRGGYPPADPPGTFPNNAGLTHIGNGAAGFFGAGADPGTHTSTYDLYNTNQLDQQQPQTASTQQPRTNRSPYDGWKDASEPTYPSQAPYASQEGNTSGYNMNTNQTSSPPIPGSHSSPDNVQYQQHRSSFSGDHPVFMSPQNTLNFPIGPAYGLGYAGQENTATPESGYFSSPPDSFDNNQYSQPYTQQPILFSPDQKPLAQQHQYSPPQQQQQQQTSSPETNRVTASSVDGRKIAGTGRAQRSSLTSGAALGGGLNPLLGATGSISGFSTRSAPSTSAMMPPPNPYSNFNKQPQAANQPSHIPVRHPHLPIQTSAPAPKYNTPTTAKPAQQASGKIYPPKKRGRHETSQSLEVPKQVFGHHHSELDQQPSILQSLIGGTPLTGPIGHHPVRFDSLTQPTTDTYEGSSDSSSSSDDDSPAQPSPSRGKGGAARGKAGKKGPGKDLARLPGACKNCKRLKMKCVFEKETDMTCKRCRDGGKECRVEGRKQRVPSNKREQLMNLLREKDKLIDALLRAVHNPSRLLPISFRAASPSNPSREASLAAGKVSLPPPQASNTSTRDIYAWLATSNSTQRSRSPRKSESGLEDSGDEQEEAGRAGIIDIDAREASLPVSESSLLDSISQRGAIPGHVKEASSDTLDVASSPSSGGKAAGRRPSTGELPRMHSVPDQTAPFGLFAELSLDSQTAEEREAERERQRKKLQSLSSASLGSDYNQEKSGTGDTSDAIASVVADPLEDEALGPANKNYWRPGPAQNVAFRRIISERNPPELLANGILNLDDVDKLFKLFFDRLNVFISILDPVIHTPADVFARSPFLFTVICAVASRYYKEKPFVYSVAMHYARVAAAMALIEGTKSVEICQAYVIMSVYPLPSRRWEEDRAWLYLRLAIGMATDLSLHIPSSTTKFIDERHEREILNRTRTWINCFNLDRSGATQFGKSPSIKEDTIIRHADTWYNKSPHNHCYDIHMVAYTALVRIVARFLEEVYSDPDSPTGLNKELDFVPLTTRYDAEIIAFRDQTAVKFLNESDLKDPACHYRNELLPFLVNYSRLVMFSFGFQQAFQRGTLDRGNMFVTACMESASNVLKTVIDVLAPSGYLRYAADGHFVFAAFATAFLLKLLRPPFTKLLEPDQQNRILSLINRLIKCLGSNDVAVDERHTPKLYSRFLEGLLLKRNQEMAENENKLSVPAVQNRPKTPPLHIDIGKATNAPEHVEPQLLSPTIQVQGPDEELLGTLPSHPIPTIQNHHHNGHPDNDMLGGPSMYDGYAYSTAASSTIDAPTRDTATQFSGEDVLMQGDENWIATMGALDNPAFWTNAMLPGFQWPSPPQPLWQTADVHMAPPQPRNMHPSN